MAANTLNPVQQAITLVRLQGVGWLLFRLSYAARCRLGLVKRRAPIQSWANVVAGVQDSAAASVDPPPGCPRSHYRNWLAQYPQARQALVDQAEQIVNGKGYWYFKTLKPLPGDWHRNVFTGQQLPTERHWSQIPEFEYGDIKHLWEPGRFAWALTLARAYHATGDEQYTATFWQLFDNWWQQNPPNQGIHWRCGQETGLRAMVLCLVHSVFAESPSLTKARQAQLVAVAQVSAQRILANIDYAYSQNNNHGTSEAAALFVLGCYYPGLPEAVRWRQLGLQGLEQQLSKLVYPDGTFSQHSFNYHRVMLQTVSLVRCVAERSGQGLPAAIVNAHARAARCLAQALNPQTGQLPMNGGSDGAWIFPLSSTDYLDYRPSAQAALRLAGLPDIATAGHWDEESLWLGAVPPDKPAETSAPAACYPLQQADYVIWQWGALRVYLRATERYRHRPAQPDQLHMDIYWQGQPLFSDPGSYSYNNPEWSEYFSSTAAHNTACFDQRDQMPRLSRFLYREWRGVQRVSVHKNGGVFRFTDYQGAQHERRLEWQDGALHISDTVRGPFQRARLNWHVHPSNPVRETGDRQVSIGPLSLQCSHALIAGRSWQADYYAEKQESSAFSVDLDAGRAINTVVIPPA